MSQEDILSALRDYKLTCAAKYGILELGVSDRLLGMKRLHRAMWTSVSR